MVNEIGFASREKLTKAWCPPRRTDSVEPVLRHLRHALAVQIDFANALYPREDVINSLAA